MNNIYDHALYIVRWDHIIKQGLKCRTKRHFNPCRRIGIPIVNIGVEMSGVEKSGVQVSGVKMSGVEMSGYHFMMPIASTQLFLTLKSAEQ